MADVVGDSTGGGHVAGASGAGRPPVLRVSGLSTSFPHRHGVSRAVDDVSFEVGAGEILGIVGESGSGKSTLGLSIMGLVPHPGRVVAGSVLADGQDLLAVDPETLRRRRGNDIAMVFQNPVRSLHPAFTVGWQLREAVRTHHPRISRKQAHERALEVLADVGVPEARRRIDDYPHQFSGGMQQRVMIAMALVNRPKVLIADEPTTALDVTIQAQILDLIRRLSDEHGMAVLFITHNLGVVSTLCERVIVMYAGQAVEQGPVEQVFTAPRHPYTLGLLRSLPESATGNRIIAIPGSPPQHVDERLLGCRFRARCPYEEHVCQQSPELLPVPGGGVARCWVSQRDGVLPIYAVREPA